MADIVAFVVVRELLDADGVAPPDRRDQIALAASLAADSMGLPMAVLLGEVVARSDSGINSRPAVARPHSSSKKGGDAPK